ncbi:MAG: FHA domain-containing protein, partial [Acidobacteriota bacterium]
MNAVAPSGQAYRLRGQVAGRERRFPIDTAGTTVGSAADQDVVLTDDGVSRRHALLSIDDGRLTVRDLGSKNGTRIDDQRLAAETTTQVEIGCTLGFGPVELVVEAVAPADTRLGLTLDPEPDRRTEPAVDPASTVGLPSGPAGRWLDLLDTLLARRERGETSTSSLLAEIAIGLGARGALIVRGRRAPEVIAAWGDVRPIETTWSRRSPGAEAVAVIEPTAEGVIVSASLGGGESIRAIGLHGPVDALAVVRPLLSIVL